MTDFRKQLQQPSNEYRSVPFWAWNDKLSEDRICTQIKDMKSQHMGGFFIHSREGLETPYLSDEWMNLVDSAIENARSQKLDIWVYDEDKWPSGMAGGMITKQYPEYAAKAITLHTREDGTHFYQVESSGNSEWYNDYAPADNLDKKSVQAFIKLTHEKYKQNLQNSNFNAIQGFFSDEPNICDFFADYSEGKPWLPWSDHFENEFLQKRGYKIEDCLDGLFFEQDNSKQVRHDYCKTITELFGENYFEQIAQWLHAHHMKFAGHLLFENDFGYNARSGGAIMSHYRYFDIPGIDILGEQDRELLTVKQCTSVAHQFGKKHVFTEIYGCTKWDLGIEGQKWLADWQFIMGVTKRCQHLFMYSIKGLRKRDYPPVFSEQTTLWENSSILEDYYARFAVCNTYGEVKRDILVLHPQSSVWLYAGSRETENLKNWDENMGWTDAHFIKGNAVGDKFGNLVKGLLAIHRDCDLGDELLMEKHGFVEKGKFYIKKAGYQTVLIPQIENIYASSIHLFQKFLEDGGTVITIGAPPRYVDGKLSDEGVDLYNHERVLRFSDEKNALAYIQTMPNEIEIFGTEYLENTDILTMYREIPEGSMLICNNHNRKKDQEVCIRMKGRGAIEKIDLLSGESLLLPVHYNQQTEKMEFVDIIEASETYVYILHRDAAWEHKEPVFSYHHAHESRNIIMGLEHSTSVSRDLPNVLPLDQCSYRLPDDMEWSLESPLWQIVRKVRERLGMRQIWYNGAKQRYLWVDEQHEKDGCLLELKFKFVVNELKTDQLKLACEELQFMEIYCNGYQVKALGDSREKADYYLDPSLQIVTIPGHFLVRGENELLIKVKYAQRLELEDMFLLGDFKVEADRSLSEESTTLLIGDWCQQGYPFYGGGMTYHYRIKSPKIGTKRAFLYLDKWEASAVVIKINNEEVGFIGWKGRDGLDITDYLNKSDTCEIEIKVLCSPRNIFGPFHQKYEKNIRSSYADYRTEGKEYSEQYSVKQQGLMKPVVICLKE